MLPEKVSVTATLSVIKTGPQHASAVASVKEVTCFVQAEQKLIGLPSLAGAAGAKGASASVEVGTTTTLPAGSSATVVNVGTDQNAILNFGIPKGADGTGADPAWGNITGDLENQYDLQTALDAKADTADLGDLAYEDNVDYSDLTNKPTLGALAAKDTADYATDVTNKPTLGTMSAVNDASSDDKTYGRKNGTWVEVTGGGGGGSANWGDIGGTLSDQTDLANALTAKADKADLAEEFDATKNYSEDACVIYNNVLYVFNEYKAAGAWDANKVTQLATLPIVDRKLAWKANVYEIALPFETSQSYSAGDYVAYDNHLFLFLSDKAAGAWDWNKARPTAVDVVMTQRLGAKQDTLTFDTTPTASSTNPVTSGGIKTALNAKQDNLTFDTTPTASSTNPVTSGGVKAYIDSHDDFKITGSVSSGGYTLTDSRINSEHWELDWVRFATPSNVKTDISWSTDITNHTVTLSATYAGATNVTVNMHYVQ